MWPFSLLTRAKAVPANVSPVADNRGAWFPLIRESYTGAWQRGDVILADDGVLASTAVYRCITLLASDIAKMRIKLMSQEANGLWRESFNLNYSSVLRKPNRYQNRIQFFESWMISKLSKGNAYILKERNARGVVTALYVLSPNLVKPMVSSDGAIFYELRSDNLSGVPDQIMVPASEIIHDRMNCLYHPLVGTSPIYACGLDASQAQAIKTSQAWFFKNNSQPGGILTAPGAIADATATRLKEAWEENYSGKNAGRIAVMGDGLTYTPMAMTAEASQLVEQMKLTTEAVCAAYGVPPFKIGAGAPPTAGNSEVLERSYYVQALQIHVEAIELCIDEGLALPSPYGTEFDLDTLLRLDAPTLVTSVKDAVSAGVMTPNEGRRKLDLPPVRGGDSPYLQQQNYSLEALAKRDAKADPFAKEEGGVMQRSFYVQK